MPQVMDAFKSQSISPSLSSPIPPSSKSALTLYFFSPMSTSLTLHPFADFIRHGKHARAAQSADPSLVDAHPNPTDQHLHEHQQPDRREREREREREARHEYARDKAHTKVVAEAIVKEEKAANEKMPLLKGLERFRLLGKMGE